MPNLVNMPVSRKRMQQFQNMQMRQIEHAAKQWEARENKVKNNALRRKWIEQQDAHNYRVEYNRLLNDMEHRKLGATTKTQLQNRANDLKKLFSSGNV
jgi:hypothetical protein